MVIDLQKWEIRYWLDGNFNEKKTKQIEKKNVAYYPLVTLREFGNQIVLNPFSAAPQEVFNK